MSTSERILAIDDQPQMTRVLWTVLTSQGYEVRTTADGTSATAILRGWRPGLVTVGMSKTSGIDLCRQIRATSNVLIIVLSTNASEESKVEAFEAGADDYVVKPFGTRELAARVRAILRRAPDENPSEPTELEIGDFRIDLALRRIYVRGHEVRLTPKEFDLFLYLARRPNRVIEHRRLLEAVWGEGSQEHAEYLRVFVGQLRKKLEPDPSTPRYLATEPWVGYRFNACG